MLSLPIQVPTPVIPSIPALIPSISISVPVPFPTSLPSGIPTSLPTIPFVPGHQDAWKWDGLTVALSVIDILMMFLAGFSFVPLLTKIRKRNTTLGLHAWSVAFGYMYMTAQLVLWAVWCTWRSHMSTAARITSIGGGLSIFVLWLGECVLVRTISKIPNRPSEGRGVETENGTVYDSRNEGEVNEVSPLLLYQPHSLSWSAGSKQNTMETCTSIHQMADERAFSDKVSFVTLVCSLWTFIGGIVLVTAVFTKSTANDQYGLVQTLFAPYLALSMGYLSTVLMLASITLQFFALTHRNADRAKSILSLRTFAIEGTVSLWIGIRLALLYNGQHTLPMHGFVENSVLAQGCSWSLLSLESWYFRFVSCISWIGFGTGQTAVLCKVSWLRSSIDRQ